MNRLRVALVTNRFLPQIGGAEINIDHQARYLARHVELTVFCPKRVRGASAEARDGFRIRRLKDWLNLKNAFPNSRAGTFCPSLFFRILFGRYDLVHCFPSLNRNNLLAALAARLSGKKIVFCFFDYLDYAAIIKATGEIDPRVLEGHRPNAKCRLVLGWMHQIFAIAHREIAFLKRFNPNVSYSPVPVLLDEYTSPAPSPRAKYGIGGDAFVFLCLNRLSLIKGQDLALAAFARVAKELPGAWMVFVGNDHAEPPFTARMKQLVQENALQDRVLFTGLVAREEVLGWLRHSDIQVVPARFMNSGAVVVESWISGTPVIQSDAVDPDLVVEGVNGFRFESQNVAAMADKMLLAFHRRMDLPAMAQAGKTLVLEKYTYDYLTRLYLETYARLTGRHDLQPP